MKTISLLAAALILVARAFNLDLVNVLGIAIAFGIAGIFLSDYSSSPTYNLEAAKVASKKTSDAGVEFATLATFDSMIG